MGRFAELAHGKSGEPALERALLDIFEEAYELFCTKQRDYGRGNISKFGQLGVLVRTSDKVERLSNLILGGRVASNEPIEDSWKDILNYGAIGLLCLKGQWPEQKKYDSSSRFSDADSTT